MGMSKTDLDRLVSVACRLVALSTSEDTPEDTPKECTTKIDKDGNKFWYLDDQLHREDGPAVIRSDGNVEYWLKGVLIPKECYKNQITK